MAWRGEYGVLVGRQVLGANTARWFAKHHAARGIWNLRSNQLLVAESTTEAEICHQALSLPGSRLLLSAGSRPRRQP